MEVTQDLRERAGLQWVLDRLAPLSPFGRAAARSLRWYGPGEEAALEAELSNVEQALPLWAENPPHFRAMTRCLPLFHDIRGSLDREADSPFDLVELFELKHFLLTLEQISAAYGALRPFSGVTLIPMEEALDLLDPSGRRLPAFAIEDACHPDLPALRREKAAVEAQIRAASGADRPALLERRRVLAVREEALELEVRRALTGRLMALRGVFLSNMEALGRLDLILAKALLARRQGCIRPVLRRDGRAVLRGLRHPQVAADLEVRGEAFTPVDIDLSRGCTVITGANMGGKTVSLRAVTLSLLLCQCGFFVFAARAELPLFHRAALILADSGPGGGGLSSFGVEVHALDALLRESRGIFFFLALDEFARGTNPQEGAALARTLVQYLNGLHCVALMTTHYDGVSDAARAHYQVAGLVREISGDEGDDPRTRIARRMDYRLLPAPPGAPCPRDALRVCRLLDLDANLLSLFSENS